LLWSRRISEAPLTASAQVAEGARVCGGWGGGAARGGGGVGASGVVAAVDEHPAAFLYGSPVVAGGLVLIGVASVELTWEVEDFSFRGSLVALDAGSGEERWRLWMTGDDAEGGAGVSVWSSPAVDEEAGLAFVGTGNAYEAPAGPLSDGIVAVELGSGRLVWKRQFTEGDVYSVFGAPPLGPDADVGAAPNLFVAGGRAVVGVGDKAGVYSALDRATGEVVWARALTPGSHLGG
jgi:polyvinyl alcohol dehydrogenase (cytochrome)